MVASKATKPPVNVFVYGTLKKDHALHNWMNGSEFVTFDELAGHTLIDLGPYPALVKVESPQYAFKTQGEVYAMPAEHFADLRAMEENVGYRTVEVVTRKGQKAYTFLFTTLTSGLAAWVKDGNKARVEVSLDDEIPF